MNRIISLHKPNEQHISNLEVMGLKRVRKYSGVNELSFNIPVKVKDNKTGEFVDNPDVVLIKQNYFVKFDSAWYVITKINKKYEQEKITLEVGCFGRVYTVKNKRVKDLITGEVVGNTTIPVKNLTDTANLLLANCTYSLNNVDVSLDLKYRAINLSTNVLDGLNKLCELWGCAWQADDTNKKINFVNYKNDGTFYGNYLTDGNYLKTLSLEQKQDSIITRLHLYSKNGYSINSVNLGQDYIDDLSYYMNLDYMSQNLIDNLNNYNTAIVNNSSTYSSLLSQKSTYQSSLATKQSELSLLQTDLNNIQVQIDTANANGDDITALNAQKVSKQSEIDSKQSEIDSVNSSIISIDSQITTIVNSTNISNYLTPIQLEELKEFLFEDDYDDPNGITDQIYDDGSNAIPILQEFLTDGREYLNKNNTPRYTASLDVVAFNQVQNDPDCKIDGDNLKLGSIIKVNLKKLKVAIDTKVLEIEESFDDYELNIKISNDKEIKDGSFKINELLQSASDTKNLVASNIGYWDDGGKANNVITEYLNNSIDLSTQAIKTSDNSFQLNNRGLVMVDKTNSQYQMIATSNGILLSENGGSSYNIAIGKGKIIGEVIGGKIIVGNSGKFNKIETYNSSNQLTCEVGNYTSQDGITQKQGIKISNGALEIVGGITESQLSSSVANAYVKLGSSYNNLIFDSTNGITVTRGDNKSKALLNATDGFKFQWNNGSSFIDKLYMDISTGDIITSGILKVKDIQSLDGVSWLNNGKIKDGYIESLTANKITAGTINASVVTIQNLTVGTNVSMGANATISWNQVTGKSNVVDKSNGYTYLTPTSIYSPYIEGGTINGAYINTAVNATVGNDLYIGSQTALTNKNIYFYNNGGDARVTFQSDGKLLIHNWEDISIDTQQVLDITAFQGLTVLAGGIDLNVYGSDSIKIGEGSNPNVILSSYSYLGSISSSNMIATVGWVQNNSYAKFS